MRGVVDVEEERAVPLARRPLRESGAGAHTSASGAGSYTRRGLSPSFNEAVWTWRRTTLPISLTPGGST